MKKGDKIIGGPYHGFKHGVVLAANVSTDTYLIKFTDGTKSKMNRKHFYTNND